MKQGRIRCVWQGSRQHAMTYLDERETAVHNYEQMLALNPDDNQGIRYLLGLYYLDLGQTMACEKLLYQYNADTTTFHTYNRALCTFMISGDGELSRSLLAAARAVNKHVPLWLKSVKELPPYRLIIP
jgi:hypothetical protein